MSAIAGRRSMLGWKLRPTGTRSDAEPKMAPIADLGGGGACHLPVRRRSVGVLDQANQDRGGSDQALSKRRRRYSICQLTVGERCTQRWCDWPILPTGFLHVAKFINCEQSGG